MSLCILIPALVGLISGILGYLLGKMGSKNNDGNLSLQTDLEACRANSKSLNARIAALETELSSAKASKSSSFTSSSSGGGGVSVFPWNADLAFSVLGKRWKQDDLKIVEGIGPKIEELFHNAGIKTWKTLSETSVEKLQAILDEAGERFSIHNPTTWSKQAELAYHGKWQELKSWQDELEGGKE